jgi:hypothetical protein
MEWYNQIDFVVFSLIGKFLMPSHLSDNERTKLLKTHINLYDEWKRLLGLFEEAQKAVVDYQRTRDNLELSSDPKKQKDRENAQREMEKRIKQRNSLFIQKEEAHKKFGDFDRQVERNHGNDFYELMIKKHQNGKTTWN